MISRRLAALTGALLITACQQGSHGAATALDLSSPKMHAMPSGTVAPAGELSPYLRARVDIVGLQPDSRHPVWVGPPGCTLDGKVLTSTEAADATGRASFSLVPPGGPAQGGSHGVVVSVGPGTTEPAEAAPLACADVSGGAAALRPAPAFSRARVAVDMRYDRATRVLTVHVRASGLEPGTRHPNHIHTGQCELEGPVRETLHTLVADAQGNADVTTPIPQSDGIMVGAWYVAVHNGPHLESQAQYALLACGDVATVSSAIS